MSQLGWGADASGGSLNPEDIYSLPSVAPRGTTYSLYSGSSYLRAYSSGPAGVFGVVGNIGTSELNFVWTPTAVGVEAGATAFSNTYPGMTSEPVYFNLISAAGRARWDEVELGTAVITGTVDGLPAGNSLSLTIYGVYSTDTDEFFLGGYGVYRMDWGYTLLGAQLFWTNKVGTQET